MEGQQSAVATNEDDRSNHVKNGMDNYYLAEWKTCHEAFDWSASARMKENHYYEVDLAQHTFVFVLKIMRIVQLSWMTNLK